MRPFKTVAVANHLLRMSINAENQARKKQQQQRTENSAHRKRFGFHTIVRVINGEQFMRSANLIIYYLNSFMLRAMIVMCVCVLFQNVAL